MDIGKGNSLRRLKWYSIVVGIALALTLLLAVFTNTFQKPQATGLLQLSSILIQLLLLLAVILMLSMVVKKLDAITEDSTKIEKLTATLEKNRSVLAKINQNTRLSEQAKAIACRDVDKLTLREAVFDKLQQQDFDAAYEIIDEIANSTVYKELAEQLHAEADKFRDATDAERINQVIAHIEKLFESYEWPKASILIERLIKTYPDSEEAKQMRQKLLDGKEERKKALLNLWDDAVKRQATDQSLEILRELDLYLTPNEGLALQEAARDVFRTKLHNLGVQFSIAVSAKHWDKALETGRQIAREFPNSKMAEEIRERWDILKQRAEQQST